MNSFNYSLGGGTAFTCQSKYLHRSSLVYVKMCAVCEKWLLCICGTHFTAVCTQIHLNLIRLRCQLTSFKFLFGNFEHVLQRQQSSKINLGGVLYYMCFTFLFLFDWSCYKNEILDVSFFFSNCVVILWLMCSNPDKGSQECWHGLNCSGVNMLLLYSM